MWILFGGLLGTIMWFNVWFVIWPRQKKILGGLAAGTPHPDAAALAVTAGKASRFNTYASGPMLFGMMRAHPLSRHDHPRADRHPRPRPGLLVRDDQAVVQGQAGGLTRGGPVQALKPDREAPTGSGVLRSLCRSTPPER